MLLRDAVPLDDPLTVLANRKVYFGVRGPDGKLGFESF